MTDERHGIEQKGHEGNVEEWIMRKYEDLVVRVQRHRKEDLQLVSGVHLADHAQLTLCFTAESSDGSPSRVRRAVLQEPARPLQRPTRAAPNRHQESRDARRRRHLRRSRRQQRADV